MKFVAFLRGINVSGQRIIKMKELSEALTDSGYEGVKTYIQSGNVIFESQKKSTAVLSGDISNVIKKSFGHDVDIIVVSQNELEKIIDKAPFKKKDLDKKLYVTFISAKPDSEKTKLIKSLSNPMETFILNGSTLYTIRNPKLSFDKTVLGTIDKKLKMTVTTRNWNVVNKVYELMN